jgi:hypothetical protein
MRVPQRRQRRTKGRLPKLPPGVAPDAQDEDMMQATVDHARCHATALALGLALGASALPARAIEIYRCPGQPAVYTSDLRLVRSNQCTRLGAAPPAARAAAAVAPVSTAARTLPAAAPARAASEQVTVVPRELQQQRDSDRVQILQAEQTRERERLAQLTQQQRALESAGDGAGAARPEALALAQAIRRSETDLQALDKELARTLR